jgi:excisionase family DNA binding protein
MNTATQWLTTVQAAEWLGVDRSSVIRWTDAGLLPCYKTPGGHRRISLDELQAWVDGRRPDVSADGGNV